MSNLLAITYDDVVTVTPSDTKNDPAGPFMGLVVTGAGSLKVTTDRGSVTSYAAVVVGQPIPVPISRVWVTGTSATVVGMVGGPTFPRGNAA